MKPKLNKAIDSGLDNVLNNGLDVNIVVPFETLLSVAATVLLTAIAIMLSGRIIKSKL